MSSAAGLDVTEPIEDVVDSEDTTDPVEDTVEDIEDPTELPDETVGTVNDTINELTEPEPTSSADPDGGDDGGSGKKKRGGTSDTSTDGSPTTGSGDGDGRSGTTAAGPETDPSGPDPNGSYTSLATRGALAALERALGLAGPLAPPLLLAGIALMTAAGVARGRSRLVKTDTGSRFPEHSFKL